MSIEIGELTKRYGKQLAVDHISFKIETGEIVGFLGPNGAGKSTTMKILAGYIPQDEGTASICGLDVTNKPLEVKKLIGYLPEHNPLYFDMYVSEFLDFVARVNKVQSRQERVEEIIGLTGLSPEKSKRISALSKGYRQRVGLAQALIHKPKVLILDEPTSGLDPNQVVEIRKLITKLGKDCTVMLSTHIMQEVEAMCSRVIIINQGKIVADDSTENISRKVLNSNIVIVQFKAEVDLDSLRKISGIEQVEILSPNRYRVRAREDVDLQELLFNFAVNQGTIILEQNKEKVNLESVFQQLTKND
jgi:ABC-2 type transport system ATP-binding protein